MDLMLPILITSSIIIFAGSVLVICGLLIWKKEKISLIHDYHYAKVSEESKKPYTEGIGKACLILGIGMIIAALVNILTVSFYGWIIFVVTFIWGCAKAMKIQRKFNNGLF